MEGSITGPSIQVSPAIQVWCCLLTPRFMFITAAVIAAIAFSSFIVHDITARRNDSDRQSLAVALSSLRASNVRAAQAETRAKVNAARGDSAERQVVMYEAVARRQVAKSTEAWARFDSLVKENVCDSSCITAARSAHLSDSVALAAKDSALAAEKVAAARYKLGLEQAVTALTELRQTSVAVNVAAQPFVKPPSRWKHVLPHLGVSATAGLDLQGKPNVVTGVSLGWDIF